MGNPLQNIRFPRLGNRHNRVFLYTGRMRRTAYVLIILLFTIFPAFSASQGQFYSVSLTPSLYLSIPHFEDEIPVRTSAGFAASFDLLGYQTQKASASVGVQLGTVTASIPFGSYRARGFTTIGLQAKGGWNITPTFSLTSQIGTEINIYKSIEEVFASFSFQIGPQFLFMEKGDYQLFFTLPLSLHLRKEITAIQAGVGFRYQYFPKPKQGEQQ